MERLHHGNRAHLDPVRDLVAIFYYLTQMVEALAGKITIADFAINLWANLKLQYIVPYTFGGGGIVYGIYQRRLRKRGSRNCRAMREL